MTKHFVHEGLPESAEEKCGCGHTARAHGYFQKTFDKTCGICKCKKFHTIIKEFIVYNRH